MEKPISENSLVRRLKLNQLMIFDRVLETRSVMRAANELSLTQPAVTRVIQELESYFGEALFLRSNRGVVPTDLGALLGRRVKSLMAEIRYMTDEVNDFRLGTSGHVVAGTLISASARLLPHAITALKARSPRVLVTVREGTTAQLFPALATGDLDVVVGRLPEQELPIANAFPLTHEVLFEESMCVVVGKGFSASSCRIEHLSQLADSPWILPTPDSPSRLAAEHLFRAAGLPLPVDIVESLSLLTNIGLLLETQRVALMPRVAARQFEAAGVLRILDLPETGAFGTIGFSVRSNKQHSAACLAFIECLRRVATETTHEIG
ncbi:LysR substrate-binding domain-containing protein [Paraburkholderia phytofirmans]|uniref:Transcriptional regulator, LysR family n=1 Tax=Paraburkholderia phytofirmans (strain DSM 17436 / LMG 22146 / PsJN) TaxID=398527 RepID=B2T9K3_PARPJ|nr:LysR substrate-binding domain-containing protein [Paraburkholderia phytofirmans]ACD21105.1 transcriptional regulator, LysR family [Paraburkholderia phytofirmans PsJN]